MSKMIRSAILSTFVTACMNEAQSAEGSGNGAVQNANEIQSYKFEAEQRFNASYEKDEKTGKPKIVKVEKDGKLVDQKVVETPARTVKYVLEAPAFADLSQDILVSLYNDRLAQIGADYVKSEEVEKLIDGASFTYTVSASDLLVASSDISDELVAKAQESFMAYLKTQGKSDRAQKNNAAFMVMQPNRIAQSNPDFVAAYKSNLQKFVEASNMELLQEIEPVLTRAGKRLDRAENTKLGDLI